jgi:hypothetical protein
MFDDHIPENTYVVMSHTWVPGAVGLCDTYKVQVSCSSRFIRKRMSCSINPSIRELDEQTMPRILGAAAAATDRRCENGKGWNLEIQSSIMYAFMINLYGNRKQIRNWFSTGVRYIYILFRKLVDPMEFLKFLVQYWQAIILDFVNICLQINEPNRMVCAAQPVAWIHLVFVIKGEGETTQTHCYCCRLRN